MQGADEILAEYGIGFEDVITNRPLLRRVSRGAARQHGRAQRVLQQAGPASTGIPVRGFEQAATRTVIDLRLLRGWKHRAGSMDRDG